MDYIAPIAESKKNHLWRKTVWHTDPDERPLMAAHSVEVYCCEEVNGYAVWYVRRLGKTGPGGMSGVENGDYLLRFFLKSATRRGDRMGSLDQQQRCQRWRDHHDARSSRCRRPKYQSVHSSLE